MTPLTLDQLNTLRLQWLQDNAETIQKIITVVRQYGEPYQLGTRTYLVCTAEYKGQPITAALLEESGPYRKTRGTFQRNSTLRVVLNSAWDTQEDLVCLYREISDTSPTVFTDTRFIPGDWTIPFLEWHEQYQRTHAAQQQELESQEAAILARILWLQPGQESPLVSLPPSLKLEEA